MELLGLIAIYWVLAGIATVALHNIAKAICR